MNDLVPLWKDILSLFGTTAGILTPVYAWLRYWRDRRFSSVSDKKRFNVFKRIGLLQQSNNPQKKNMIKTLYESIGVSYPPVVIDSILSFINEKGLRFNHPDLNYFFTCSWIMDISETSICLNPDKVSTRKIATRWAVIFVALGTVVGVAAVTSKARSAVGIEALLFHVVIAIIYLLWSGFIWLWISDGVRIRGAQSFYEDYSAWLQCENNKQVESSSRKGEMTQCTDNPATEIAPQRLHG
jgi:hypothetical protein